MRSSISAKSAASTPPAPARIVTTASRWSYSPASRVRTSSSPRSLRILTSSASASARRRRRRPPPGHLDEGLEVVDPARRSCSTRSSSDCGVGERARDLLRGVGVVPQVRGGRLLGELGDLGAQRRRGRSPPGWTRAWCAGRGSRRGSRWWPRPSRLPGRAPTVDPMATRDRPSPASSGPQRALASDSALIVMPSVHGARTHETIAGCTTATSSTCDRRAAVDGRAVYPNSRHRAAAPGLSRQVARPQRRGPTRPRRRPARSSGRPCPRRGRSRRRRPRRRRPRAPSRPRARAAACARGARRPPRRRRR